jgi:hypothetical protein
MNHESCLKGEVGAIVCLLRLEAGGTSHCTPELSGMEMGATRKFLQAKLVEEFLRASTNLYVRLCQAQDSIGWEHFLSS